MRREAQRVWPFINTEKSHGSLQAVREENDIFVCASWKINQLVFKESQRRRHLSEPGDSIYISSLPFGGFSLMQQKRREEEENRAGQSAATPPGFAQQINICSLWTFCTQLLKTNQKTCLFACILRRLPFFWWWHLKLLKRRKLGWTQQWRFPEDLDSQRAVRRIRAPSLHRRCHSAGSFWKSAKNVTSHPVLTNSEKRIHLQRNRKTCGWNSIIIITVEEIALYS